MAIHAVCPSCDREYTLADEKEGKTVRCKECSEDFVVEPISAKAASAKKTARYADEEEHDDRPQRRTKRRPQPKKSGSLLLWLLLGGGGVCLLLTAVVCVGALFWVGRGAGGGPGGGPGDGLNAGSVLFAFRVTEENFNKLKEGMTESEIVAILGPPLKTEDRDPQVQIAAQFEPGKIRVLFWAQEHSLVDVTLTPRGRAKFATGIFPDGNGGMKEVHGTRSGQLSNLASHGGSGPSKASSAKAYGIFNGATQEELLLGFEQPTRKLGPQKMANGQMSAETWEWKNGKGYLRVHFNSTKNVIGKEEKDLPAW